MHEVVKRRSNYVLLNFNHALNSYTMYWVNFSLHNLNSSIPKRVANSGKKMKTDFADLRASTLSDFSDHIL